MTGTGCVVPGSYTARPGASACVIDGTTGAPVPGASVRLEGPVAPEGDEFRPIRQTTSTTTETDRAGAFAIPPLRKLGLLFIIPRADPIAPSARLTITRTGYSTKTLGLFVNDSDARDVHYAGRISLPRSGR